MTDLTVTVRSAVQAKLVGSNDLSDPTWALQFAEDVGFTYGTGPGQADLIFADERTIAASGSEDIDLAGGVISDPLGSALTFVKLKGVWIKADATNVNNVLLGDGGGPVAGLFENTADRHIIQPGARYSWVDPAGITITATSADDLGVANSSSGTSVTYQIVLIGSSA